MWIYVDWSRYILVSGNMWFIATPCQFEYFVLVSRIVAIVLLLHCNVSRRTSSRKLSCFEEFAIPTSLFGGVKKSVLGRNGVSVSTMTARWQRQIPLETFLMLSLPLLLLTQQIDGFAINLYCRYPSLRNFFCLCCMWILLHLEAAGIYGAHEFY